MMPWGSCGWMTLISLTRISGFIDSLELYLGCPQAHSCSTPQLTITWSSSLTPCLTWSLSCAHLCGLYCTWHSKCEWSHAIVWGVQGGFANGWFQPKEVCNQCAMDIDDLEKIAPTFNMNSEHTDEVTYSTWRRPADESNWPESPWLDVECFGRLPSL